MRANFARAGLVLLIALTGILPARPAVADEIAAFSVSHDVQIGDATLAPGTYVFCFTASTSYPGVVLVYDRTMTHVLAATIVQREALEARAYNPVGELAYDTSVRTIRHEYWRYNFRPMKRPVVLASRPVAVAAEIAAVR